MWQFKVTKPLDLRRAESTTIREKNPTMVPIIIEPHSSYKGDIHFANRFIVKESLTMADLMKFLQKKHQLDKTQGFFLFLNGETLVDMSMGMSVLYRMKRDADGFLYFKYSDQDAFGSVN